MLDVILLAIIQGITEFLPVSSSAHLIIFRDLFGLSSSIGPDIALTFDIALHFGTLLAILVFFFKDFLKIFIDGVTKGPKNKEGKIMYLIIIATIPAAVLGFLLEDIIDDFFRKEFILVALALIIMGLIINIVDKRFKENKNIKSLNYKGALLIGLSQVLALMPGFSRSGTTISAARALELKKDEAARFSFYLATPIILGATALTLFKTDLSLLLDNAKILFLGVIISFVVGLICIKFLLNFLKKHDFKVFMYYRIILGIIVILYTIFR